MRAVLAALALLAAGLASAPAVDADVACEPGSTIECDASTPVCNADADVTPRARSADATANCGHGTYRCYVTVVAHGGLPSASRGCAV